MVCRARFVRRMKSPIENPKDIVTVMDEAVRLKTCPCPGRAVAL